MAQQKKTQPTTATKKIQFFEPITDQLVSLMGSNTRVKQELFFALQVINESKDLLKCTPQSLLKAVLYSLNAGLSLNPVRGEACLIARWNPRKNCYQAKYQPMYKGFIKHMKKNSGVRGVIANVVYEADSFDVNLADDQTPVRHFPCIDCPRTDDKIQAAYAIATFDDGTKSVELMTITQLNEIREMSDSVIAFRAGKIKTPPPWIKFYSQMCRKTVLRRMYNYIPEVVSDALAKIIEIDNQEYSASEGQIGFIESLLHTANIPEREAQMISEELTTYTFAQASNCISYLKNNQLEGVQMNGTGQAKSTLKQSIEEAVEADNN